MKEKLLDWRKHILADIEHIKMFDKYHPIASSAGELLSSQQWRLQLIDIVIAQDEALEQITKEVMENVSAIQLLATCDDVAFKAREKTRRILEGE